MYANITATNRTRYDIVALTQGIDAVRCNKITSHDAMNTVHRATLIDLHTVTNLHTILTPENCGIYAGITAAMFTCEGDTESLISR